MGIKVLIPGWSFYPSQEGGPSNALYWLASGLSRAGYQICVVATNRCQKPGAVVENTWQRLNGFDVVYATLDKLSSYIEEELPKCDVLLANGVCRISNFHFNMKAIRMGKKVILSPRGELLESAVNHKGKLYGLLKRVMFWLMKCSYGRRVLYHATSEEEVMSVYKYMGRNAKVVQIPNYMILPERVEDKMVETPRRYLLYVGRINHIKNIDIIIRGLAKSKTFVEGHYVFKIAGETGGEYYESLVTLANELGLSDKIEFLGLVTGVEKDRLYAGAKCLLLMSKSENFGNVIVEALSQGTPVIASKGTPWKQLDDKGAGWWIDAKPEQVAEVIDTLFALDAGKYSAMRDAAYSYSREFDIYSNIEKWTKVIDN